MSIKPNAAAVAMVAEEATRLLPLARDAFDYHHTPPVAWNLGGFLRAGLATTKVGIADAGNIRLNPALANAEGEGFRHTYGHELAHLVAVHKWGYAGTGHGYYWSRVMRAFGLPPEAEHSFASSLRMREEMRVKRGGRKVTCACGWTYVLTARQCAKCLVGLVRYRCPKCHASIIL